MHPRLELSRQECIEILSNYGLGEIRFIRTIAEGYNNANFKVVGAEGVWLLKIYLEKGSGEVRSEIALLESLRRLDFRTILPLQDRSGDLLVETLHGPVTLFPFYENAIPGSGSEDLQALGETVARLSTLDTKEMPVRENPLSFEWCMRLADNLIVPNVHGLKRSRDFFLRESPAYAEIMNAELPVSMVHGDIFPDNCLKMPNGTITLIDWEASGQDSSIIDIASAINGFCFRGEVLDFGRMNTFLQAYQRNRPILSEEWRLLPDFLRWSLHCIVGWHLKLVAEREFCDERQAMRTAYLIERIGDLRQGKKEIEVQIQRISANSVRDDEYSR